MARQKSPLAKSTIPNERLRMHRERRHWTQSELARRIGTTYLSVCRWENGATVPSVYYRQKLCDLFEVSAQELGLGVNWRRKGHNTERPPAPGWHIPLRRNPFFTGREAILAQIHDLFQDEHPSVRALAISGLGGIGKTQTALEYAYRCHNEYETLLWLGAETHSILLTNLLTLIDQLEGLEGGTLEKEQPTQALRNWLQRHTRWLLVLDNVEDFAVIEQILPPIGQGHILMTMRASSTGSIAQGIELKPLATEEGALLLLRRAKRIASDISLELADQRKEASEIAQSLAGLPLALDQAGAYIEETDCSLQDYQARYQRYQIALLEQRGRLSSDHPDSVYMTIALVLDKVSQTNPAALDLLRFCAFLEPDAIPLEMIGEGVVETGSALDAVKADPLLLDSIIADLRRYSLLWRHAQANTLAIHRLVQVVIKANMDETTQRLWSRRAISAVNRLLPEGSFANWARCQRYLAQAQHSATLVEYYGLLFPEAAQLLQKAGSYLIGRGFYVQAGEWLQRTLALREHLLGSEHREVAITLTTLAECEFYQGHYDVAAQFLRRALIIHEREPGPDRSQAANAMDMLALVYYYQGKYSEAEALYLPALSIKEQVFGVDHIDTADTLNNMALLYQDQARYKEAEPLYRRVLAIHRENLGAEHPSTAIALDNLARLYFLQERYNEATPLYRQALAIEEKVLGLEHVSTAITLSNIGQISHAQGQYEEANALYLRALAIQEKVLGVGSAATSYTQMKLARLYHDQQRYKEAEALYQCALEIAERYLGQEHPHTAAILDNIAQLHHTQSRHESARAFYRRALDIRRQQLGDEHPDTIATRERLLGI